MPLRRKAEASAEKKSSAAAGVSHKNPYLYGSDHFFRI